MLWRRMRRRWIKIAYIAGIWTSYRLLDRRKHLLTDMNRVDRGWLESSEFAGLRAFLQSREIDKKTTNKQGYRVDIYRQRFVTVHFLHEVVLLSTKMGGKSGNRMGKAGNDGVKVHFSSALRRRLSFRQHLSLFMQLI